VSDLSLDGLAARTVNTSSDIVFLMGDLRLFDPHVIGEHAVMLVQECDVCGSREFRISRGGTYIAGFRQYCDSVEHKEASRA
jgi:hypothetical protein